MRPLPLLILLMFMNAVSCAQKEDVYRTVYMLKDKVEDGDADALLKLTSYLDNRKSVWESLGYHRFTTTIRSIAMRMLSENCLFTKDELRFDSSLTAKRFLSFTKSNDLVFDDVSGMFLVTPIEKRTTNYVLRELSADDLAGIDTTVIESPYPDWYYQNQLDGFILTKDPQALKWIASAWFKTRSRFNNYFEEKEYLDFMKFLTHMELGVPDEDGQTTFTYEDDYYAKARLNYLIYWVNHYQDYQWDEEKKYFTNRKETPVAKSKTEILFDQLKSANDSVAMNAFMELTEADTAVIRIAGNDFEKNDLDRNFNLPIFAYRFLLQMTVMTEYCRNNGIRYKPERWLLDSLNKLNTSLDFSEQYRLENNIINRLTLDDITSVEYFGLVYEENGNSVYSIGRILDVFYSKHWKELIDNKSQLSWYLKKSRLYNDLGIIGTCNDYLVKFENCSPEIMKNIKEIANTSTDGVTREQARAVIKEYSKLVPYKAPVIKNWDGRNFIYGVNDFQGKYRRILASPKKKDDKRFDLLMVISDISYAQIGKALRTILEDTLLVEERDRFSFLESDFGFAVNPFDLAEVKDFLQQYEHMAEAELYHAWLLKSGFDCFDQQGDFDLNKVYDIIKYGVVKAFVGGSGGKEDDNIYLLIKMLELKFKTTLGFPRKRCRSVATGSCSCDDRVTAWMHYLEQKKLVTPDKTEPVSFAKYE